MVYVFLADGFEEIEALGTVDILRRCELDVKTVSITKERNVTGTHGICVLADILIDELSEENIDALVLPGGLPGADNLEQCAVLTDLLKRKSKEGTILAAICAAPKVFGVLGLLSGIKATCYPGFEAKLVGAITKRKDVVCDKNFITAKGAGVTQKFAAEIASSLGKGIQARRVLRAMHY